MKIITVGGLRDRLRVWFPEREFFMRSHGQVRFVTVTSRVQIAAAAFVVAIFGGWLLSLAVMALNQYQTRSERLSLLERETQVVTAESRVQAYREDLNAVAEDMQRRMHFLEEMTEMLPADISAEDLPDASTGEAAQTVGKVSAAVPEAAALVQIEARQLALVERMTRFADQRAERAEAAIRKLGLNPRPMLAPARGGLGGPLEKLSTGADGSLDPRFERLALSLTRLEALERGLNGIPQVMPVRVAAMSSGFGYRRDPFTGTPAMHSGLDFKGRIGAPIYAAADGKVTFVGSRNGYGKTVEISHGNGLMTRYAHMSGFRAKVGQRVHAGEVIGALGNTGRSTGPHLHFEVRINDRAVNPRPFLETAPHVLEEARSDVSRQDAASRGSARG